MKKDQNELMCSSFAAYDYSTNSRGLNMVILDNKGSSLKVGDRH